MTEPTDPALPAAVLFDMDGTLIDSEGLWLQTEIDVMTSLGGHWTQADQAECLGGPLERVGRYMAERATVPVTPEDICTDILARMEIRLRESPLVWRPGARDLLAETLELGVPTALVSASWNNLIDAVRDRIAAEVGRPPFTVVVAGDDVLNSKPHPEPYRTAADLIGVAAGDCLALEDSPTGVQSAVAAGCVVVAIPHIAHIDMPGATAIDTLEGRALADLWSMARTG
jgi:HAD superfamily hydrolase (TIGR01509 family)